MIVIPIDVGEQNHRASPKKLPKCMFELKNRSVFRYMLDSFKHYFTHERFVFICSGLYDLKPFIERECEDAGVHTFDVVVLNKSTLGQAETIRLGLDSVIFNESDRLIVCNANTFRPGFRLSDYAREPDGSGYVEVFNGNGPNWSYVAPVPGTQRVLQTAERRPISDLCCTGLFFFTSIKEFLWCINTACADSESSPAENQNLQIAPLYNYLVQSKKCVYFQLVPRSAVIFCETIEENETFTKTTDQFLKFDSSYAENRSLVE